VFYHGSRERINIRYHNVFYQKCAIADVKSKLIRIRFIVYQPPYNLF